MLGTSGTDIQKVLFPNTRCRPRPRAASDAQRYEAAGSKGRLHTPAWQDHQPVLDSKEGAYVHRNPAPEPRTTALRRYRWADRGRLQRDWQRAIAPPDPDPTRRRGPACVSG